MNSQNRIYLSPPHLSGNELKYITQAVESNWIAPVGPDIDRFEKSVADYVGTSGALAVSSCTAAIHLCLLNLGVKAGDTVFCSDLTFAGSCNPIVYQNAEPVFIDSEPLSSNMSPDALEEALESAKKTGKLPKAVIAVDLYGQAANYGRLLPLCDQYGVPVIEDAAEALGSEFGGKKCGSLGRWGVFSFNGNKIITTSGGGMVVSDDTQGLKRMKYLSTQAKLPVYYYEHTEIGYNYRLSNISAALGVGQLEGLDEKMKIRREIFRRYRDAFADLPVTMLNNDNMGLSNCWLSVFLIDEKKASTPSGVKPYDIIQALEALDIESRPIWKPMHLQPVFQGRRYFTHRGSSVSEKLFSAGVCLPSGSSLTEEQQQRVIGLVRDCFGA